MVASKNVWPVKRKPNQRIVGSGLTTQEFQIAATVTGMWSNDTFINDLISEHGGDMGLITTAICEIAILQADAVAAALEE